MLKLGSLSLRPAFRLRASRIKTWPSLWAAFSGFALVQGKSGGCAELESFQSDLGALGVGRRAHPVCPRGRAAVGLGRSPESPEPVPAGGAPFAIQGEGIHV